MVTVGSATPTREFVEAVSRIIAQVGENVISTLLNPTKRISMAMDAVRDARDEVYYRTKWDFRRGYLEVDLVANQMWYSLPSDYQEMASDISLNRKEPNLEFLNYDNLMSLYPELRMFPPGSAVGDIVTAGQAVAQTENFGTPEYYTTLNDYLGLIPIPNATFVALEDKLFALYWKQAPTLVSDNDDIGLPRNLWNAANLLALANLKRGMDLTDWQSDKADGLSQLRRQASGRKEVRDFDVGHRTSYNE